MIAPLMLDGFQPVARQAVTRQPYARTGDLFLDTNALLGTDRDAAKMREQVRAYRYWNYVAINRIADRCAGETPQFGYVTTRRDGDQRQIGQLTRQHLQRHYGVLQHAEQDMEPLPDSHPMCELFQRVNGEDSYGEFLFETIMMWKLTGQFFWWVIPNGMGLPAELWVIPSQWVSPRYAKSGQLVAWEIRPDNGRAGTMELPPNEVLQGKFKSPRSKVDGHSPLEAAPRWTDNVEAIEQSRGHAFANGTNPDLWLELDKDKYPDPAPDVLTKIKEKFLRRAGGFHRTGEPLITPPGVIPHKWSNTPKEMDFGTSATQARDNALALHGVPPVVAGISSDYTRATADAAAAVFCEVTINPLLTRFAGIVTEKLACRWDARIRMWFHDCVPDDSDFKLRQQEAAFKMGGWFPNDQRVAMGLEPIDDPRYNTGYLPAGQSPLNDDLQPEDLPDDDEPIDEDDDDEAGDE